MSQPWFSGRGRAYCPPHLRQQPEITVTISPSHNVSSGRRRNAVDPSHYISNKFDNLEVTSRSEEEQETKSFPVEATGTDIPPPATSFSEIGFCAKVLTDNIRRCKYVNPTPIQRYAIPVAIAGRDLMACAQTGSGKTAAFCFPIIDGIMLVKQQNKGFFGNNIRMACPIALILAPTRELACQIHDEAKKFSHQTGVRVVAVYGGAPVVHQLRNLERGVDILVATPGRLVDMIERTRVSLKNIKYLALDEADRMLDMGFEPQVREIVQQMGMPPPGLRQTMLFSATFPAEIKRLASDFLSNYIFLAAGKVGSSTDLIVQRVEYVTDIDKRGCLVNLLRCHETNMKDTLTLVFVETKRGADTLESWLSRKGFPSTAIHGDKVQVERERALRSFRSGRTPILVATDVAARGLDIPHVAHVINFDLPRSIDDYVHRIGRTGRAGKSGLATAFFSEKNAPLAKELVQLMQEANQEVPIWLTEYTKMSSNSRGGNGRRYGGYGYKSGVGSDNYLSRSAETTYGDPYAAAASYNNNVNFSDVAGSYVSGSYKNGNNKSPVVASGWD
ncbi:hypothetical protein CASFOL_014012 [Castilleja foliolosa]|uniref:RNA helicase n=1 Tax=Castilleja foliolosa TaxID=1961234 RepID=A0ABD3DMA2_9LAMI